jgi:short-subunit dehydrogenase
VVSYLENKSVLITGASSGIGSSLARELASRGCRLGLVARRDERLASLSDELSEKGSRVAWAAADVTDRAALHGAFDTLSEQLGAVDVMVANAGYGLPEQPHKFRPDRSRGIYTTNLLGMVHTCDWALPRFYERSEGHLVGIASVASYFGMPNSASYCGSKAAMRVHLQALRLTWRPYGIHVTTICPGYVESELTEDNRAPMPFIWPVERAARVIAQAIERRRAEVVFPWQMRVATMLLTVLPRAAVERLIGLGVKRKS